MERIDPKKIYDYIIEKIEELEVELENNLDQENYASEKMEVLKLIQKFKATQMEGAIETLKRTQEWDTFTIAFYGETNAGKSTIIESLRLYFREKEKVETQKRFHEKDNFFKDQLLPLDKKIIEDNILIEKNQVEKENVLNFFEKEKENIECQKKRITDEHLEKVDNSLIYRMLLFLKIMNIKNKIEKLEKQIKFSEKKCKKSITEIKEKDKNLKKSIEELQNDSKNLSEKRNKELMSLSDGQIIGDGRSDFTKETANYYFEKNEQNFSILDVPGIEGKEDMVIDEISSAVKKAHVVFYITSSPTPPQKGDSKKKGTLEKIKEHLGSQTEVYTIFNKRVTNPIQLKKDLVSDGEKQSLEVLDGKMKEIINTNYVGTKCLSAKVSFLALSECLLETSSNYIEKNKFLNKLEWNVLFKKSLFLDFCNFLENELVQNTKQKIKRSNFNKANKVLENFIMIISGIEKTSFSPLSKEITKEIKAATHNLDTILIEVKNKTKNQVKEEAKKFKFEIRKKIYSEIDKDISDTQFKEKLESLIEEGSKRISIEVPKVLDNEISIFKMEIEKVINNFKRRINRVIKDFETISLNLNGSEFKINLNMSSGIDGVGIFSSLVGGGVLTYTTIMATNAWNPLGWVMFGLGVLGVVIGFAKSIFKFFSSDYKKSEQRRVVDENIDKISKDMEKQVIGELEIALKDFEKQVASISDELKESGNKIVQMSKYLLNSCRELEELSEKIKIEGDIV